MGRNARRKHAPSPRPGEENSVTAGRGVPPVPLPRPPALRRALDGRPVVCVFGASDAAPGSALYQAARDTGAMIARAGAVVCTGGYSGVMEAASRGASDAEGLALGVLTDSFPGLPPNRWVGHVLRTRDLHVRMRRLIELGDAFVVFPGRSGTLAELAILWALLRARMTPSGRPILLAGTGWRPILEALRRQGVLGRDELRDIRLAGNPRRAVSRLLRQLPARRKGRA